MGCVLGPENGKTLLTKKRSKYIRISAGCHQAILVTVSLDETLPCPEKGRTLPFPVRPLPLEGGGIFSCFLFSISRSPDVSHRLPRFKNTPGDGGLHPGTQIRFQKSTPKLNTLQTLILVGCFRLRELCQRIRQKKLLRIALTRASEHAPYCVQKTSHPWAAGRGHFSKTGLTRGVEQENALPSMLEEGAQDCVSLKS